MNKPAVQRVLFLGEIETLKKEIEGLKKYKDAMTQGDIQLNKYTYKLTEIECEIKNIYKEIEKDLKGE